jgi:hypothetical protein
LTQKVELAQKIMESKLLPTDWIYDNIFHLSQDQYDEYRDMTVEDAKREFRMKQIVDEGNDPKVTGKSYGTPHDLALAYGKGRMGSNPENVPDGYDDDLKLGRPEETGTNKNHQDNAFGKDRLGTAAMKKDDQEGYGTPNYKGGSPLALENAKSVYAKNKTLIENLGKAPLFAKEVDNTTLLNEDQLKG